LAQLTLIMPADQTEDNKRSGLSEDYVRSVSESQLKDRAYSPYEMEKYDRDSVEEIKKSLKKGKYKVKSDIQDSLMFLEKLANKINIAVNNERKESKTTWELEADLTEVRKLFDQIEQILQTMEFKEVEDGSKAKKKIKK
jgi:formiminotetrahydrofolate cyclodeaminase